MTDAVGDRRAFLARSLADLDAERAAGDISEEDYLDLRARYEAALAEHDGSGRDRAPEIGARSRRGRGVRAVAVVTAVAMLAVGAGALVARSAGERLPGETLTGDVELGAEDRLAQAQALVERGDALEAIKLYDQILRDDPRHPAALAQRGWLLRGAGLIDEGLEYVERAIAADPDYAEAYFFRGMIRWRDKGDPAAGVADLRQFLSLTPSSQDAATVEGLLREAEAEVSAPPATTVPAQ